MGTEEKKVEYRSHDDVFVELTRKFPGIMDYLMDGHLSEVGQLVELVRDLGNELATIKHRHSESMGNVVGALAAITRYQSVLRRVGMMLDQSQMEDTTRQPSDLVSCAMPMSVAVDLMKEARPLIVAQGERQLEANGEVFEVLLMGGASDQQLQAAAGQAIRSSIDRFKNLYMGDVCANQHDTQHRLLLAADNLLGTYGWRCKELTLSNHQQGSIDAVIKAFPTPGALTIDAEAFFREMRRVAKSMLPAGMVLDEIQVTNASTGQGLQLPPGLNSRAAQHDVDIAWAHRWQDKKVKI